MVMVRSCSEKNYFFYEDSGLLILFGKLMKNESRGPTSGSFHFRGKSPFQ